MQKAIDGLLINYEIIGRRKKPLLILHGWGNSLREWIPTARQLSSKYKVILVDLPGFGGSTKPDDSWGIYEYGDFVEKLLLSLKVRRLILIGHSFGGRVGVLLAARKKLIEKLVLINAAGMETRSWKGNLTLLLAPLFRDLPQWIKNWFGSVDYKNAGGLRQILVRIVNQDLTSEMTKINCPALIIWGEKDLVLPVSQAKKMKSLIKNSVLRIVWGAGHWPHLSKTREFVDVLEEEGI